jgi:hypothetical protein
MADAQTVYVDDSGTDTKSRVAAAAFCVSTIERWQEFLEKWRKIAEHAGFELKHFHMTEFAACRREGLCQQCKAGKTSAVEHPWQKWTDAKRENVLNRMAKALVKNVEYGIGQSYTKADYDQHVRTSPARSVANEPIADEYFTFAVQRCGGSFSEWRATNARTDRLKFVFDTASSRERREIANVFFAAANGTARIKNGIERWFDPELGVSFESRKITHQLLSADMLAWTIATIRAREIFRAGRFVEVFWLAKVFVSTAHIRLGYMHKDVLAQWERDRLDESVKEQSGISEVRSDAVPLVRSAQKGTKIGPSKLSRVPGHLTE